MLVELSGPAQQHSIDCRSGVEGLSHSLVSNLHESLKLLTVNFYALILIALANMFLCTCDIIGVY